MTEFLRGEPIAILRRVRSLLCGGFLVLLISGSTDAPGIITGVFAFGLGASGAIFSHWKTEPGLWMLACVFFLMNAITYTCMVLGQIGDTLRGIRPESALLALDMAIGTLLLSVGLRFLVHITKENFAFSYERHEN